jgi:hypothetical protein
MNKKKILVLIVALILTVMIVGVAFAGTGSCKRCSCEKFTYDGEDLFGNRVCTCGHRGIVHESANN